MTDNKIIRGTLIISVSIMLSRVLGLVREMLLASQAGVGTAKNAYDLAFMIPDLINHLISTGYLSITFIPIFTGYLVKGKEDKAWEFFANVLNSFSLVLIPLIVLCWIFIEPLLIMMTRTSPDPETLRLAVQYSRIILPAQFFFFIGSLFTAIQHIRMRFVFPALNGLVYNVAIITGGWLGRAHGLSGFAWGVLAGAILGSLVLQLIGGYKAGARYSFKIDYFSRDLLHYLKISFPLILGLGAMFALEFIFRSYGAKFGREGIARLGYAYRMMYTLVAVFGFSVGAASYPLLTRLAKKNNIPEINTILLNGIGNAFALLAPIVLILWFCAEPVTRILLERGEFTAEATSNVAQLLRLYLWSAFALCAQAILVRCYFAMERMWLPCIINTGGFLCSLPLYEVLGNLLGIQGIPLAGAIGVALQVITLFIFWFIKKEKNGLPIFLLDLSKIAGCSLLLFLLAGRINILISPLFSGSLWQLLVFLTGFSLFIFSAQFTLYSLIRVSVSKSLLSMLTGRLKKIMPISKK
ncbi:MAG: murein biosynthesis integral membrane protein MurJ [Fibrobacteria bacterium]|nr:murein biosynthesis integral membrane protein MurJ [Fibrobacteria bacterium]